MHFGMKNTLKNNHNHTLKHVLLMVFFSSLSFSTLLINFFKTLFLIYFDGYKLSLMIYFNLFFL